MPSLTSPPQTASAIGPVVAATGVDFFVPGLLDVDGVRLEVDFDFDVNRDFTRGTDGWSLKLPRPDVGRLEYQLTVRSGGGTNWITDPTNPRTVPNPFGDKSEIEFPGYTAPAWLNTDLEGTITEITTDRGALDTAVPVRVWSPAGLPADQPAPLLLAHDGSDMANRGSLLRWASSLSVTLPVRVALLDPPNGYRDTWYAANTDYADHIATVVMPAIAAQLRVGPVVGLGASLGAVSMLTIQRRHPDLFATVVLQSGSFFTPRLDPQEGGYRFFDQLCAAVAAVETTAGKPVPILLTCGTVEENLANNRRMATVLFHQGYSVTEHIVRDAHTMIGWRDAWSPAMETLITGVAESASLATPGTAGPTNTGGGR